MAESVMTSSPKSQVPAFCITIVIRSAKTVVFAPRISGNVKQQNIKISQRCMYTYVCEVLTFYLFGVYII